MKFQYPTITDHGSIADHTFTRCNPSGAHEYNGNPPPPKTYITSCELDKFAECSCGS